jgi:hypothetical protein
MPGDLAGYSGLLSVFFGVFAFQTILKNTNVTVFDQGVLTIQDWIDKTLNAAASAAIARQEDLKAERESRLVARLMTLQESDINTRVLARIGRGAVAELDAAAQASGADPRQYKILQLVTTYTRSEIRVLLRASI